MSQYPLNVKRIKFFCGFKFIKFVILGPIKLTGYSVSLIMKIIT